MKRYFNWFSTLLFSVSLFLCISCKVDVSSNSDVFNFSVGDILFSDGTYIRAKDVVHGIPSEQVSKAIAVIAVVTEDGRTLGVGLNKGKNLMWAPKDSFGFNTNFGEITAKDYGSVYKGFTFSGDKDGSDNWEYVCGVDSVGSADAAVNYPVFDFANNYGVTAGLEGTEYESGWYVPSISELYGVYKNSEVVQKSLKAVKGLSLIEGYNQSFYWSSSQSEYFSTNGFQVNFENGYVDDFFSKYEDVNVVALKQFYFGKFTKYKYGIPSITSVKFPPAIAGYTGELKFTIYGENLKGYDVSCDYSDVLKLEYFGDDKVVVTIMCKGVIGEYKVNVSCGIAKNSGVLRVGTFQTYKIGDIILSDGSKVDVDDVDSYRIDGNNRPVGVVVSTLYGGTSGSIMGIHKTRAKWSIDNTTGMNSMFEELAVTYIGEKTLGYTFEGDLIGADNWDYICSVDSEAIAKAETDYPIFYFAMTYGSTAGLVGTDYENGWYIPSIVELYEIYKNIGIIQKSLTAAEGFVLASSRTECYFLSSSTILSTPYYIFNIGFFEGDVWDEAWKGNESNVLVIKDF